MNYGYDTRSKGWKPRRRGTLVQALAVVIATAPELQPTQGREPYIEVNGTYPGVRVRHLTYMPDLNAACRTLDKAYDHVMGVAS